MRGCSPAFGFSSFLLAALGVIAGCSSIDYQHPDQVQELLSRIDQAKARDYRAQYLAINQQIKIDLPRRADAAIRNRRDAGHVLVHEHLTDPKENRVRIDFSWNADKKCTIRAFGKIDPAFEAAFRKAGALSVRHGCKDVLVKVSGPGGDILSALRTGIYIRKMGFYTVSTTGSAVPGCVSACTLLYVSGVKRFGVRENESTVSTVLNRQLGSAPTDFGTLYFHQAAKPKSTECQSDPNDKGNLFIYAHFQSMSPDTADLLFAKSMQTDCRDIGQLSFREIAFHRLMNADYSPQVFKTFP
jgi:hypothetical protein